MNQLFNVTTLDASGASNGVVSVSKTSSPPLKHCWENSPSVGHTLVKRHCKQQIYLKS